MAYKFVAILAFASLASGGVIPVHDVYHHAPVVHQAPSNYAAPAPAYAPLAHGRVAVVKSPVTYAAAAPVYAPAAHGPFAVVHAHPQPVLAKQNDEYDPHPQYKYGYDIQDALSGDSKSQTEERDGDIVRGEYSLVDADGFKRVVQYTADQENGFNAVVNRVPLEQLKTVVKSVPVAYAQPAPAVVKEYAAPISYHH